MRLNMARKQSMSTHTLCNYVVDRSKIYFPLHLPITQRGLKLNDSVSKKRCQNNNNKSSSSINNIFRTMCLFLAFTNVTVTAAPSTRDLLEVPVLQFQHANKDRLLNTYQELFPSRRTSEHTSLKNLKKRLLSRRSRTSAATCQPTLSVLYNLVVHAYLKAKSVHSLRVRRFYSYRSNDQKSWGQRWKTAYDKLQLLYCETIHHPNVFGNETSDINTAVQSMLTVIQHELHKLDVKITSTSSATCRAHYSNAGNRPLVVVQKQFLNGLFGLSKELESICKNLQSL